MIKSSEKLIKTTKDREILILRYFIITDFLLFFGFLIYSYILKKEVNIFLIFFKAYFDKKPTKISSD